MKEHGIIMTAHSVLAILAGAKTQTRRCMLRNPGAGYSLAHADVSTVGGDGPHLRMHHPGWPDLAIYPRWRVGDRLWVREAFKIVSRHSYRASTDESGAQLPHRVSPDGEEWAVYRAGWERSAPRPWQSPLHMPRWASRITLEITDVRIERLLAITEDDARAEGVTLPELSKVRAICPCETQVEDPEPHIWTCPWRDVDVDPVHGPIVDAFARGWNEINGKRAPWSSNPWVSAITFRRLT